MLKHELNFQMDTEQIPFIPSEKKALQEIGHESH